jgi:hypothetical protein
MMKDYRVDVGKIEELQMINDIRELDVIFQKAKSAVVCGAHALLSRTSSDGNLTVFDTITTLEDLEAYKSNVYKYLKEDGE